MQPSGVNPSNPVYIPRTEKVTGKTDDSTTTTAKGVSQSSGEGKNPVDTVTRREGLASSPTEPKKLNFMTPEDKKQIEELSKEIKNASAGVLNSMTDESKERLEQLTKSIQDRSQAIAEVFTDGNSKNDRVQVQKLLRDILQTQYPSADPNKLSPQADKVMKKLNTPEGKKLLDQVLEIYAKTEDCNPRQAFETLVNHLSQTTHATIEKDDGC